MSTLLIPGAGLVDASGTLLIPGAGVVEQAATTATFSGAGTPTLPLLTASGTAKRALKGSGTPTLPLLTADGSGTAAEDVSSGSGAGALPLLTASGTGTKARKGSGTPSLALLTAAGSGSIIVAGAITGDGAADLPPLAAAGLGTVEAKVGGGGGWYSPIRKSRRQIEREELLAEIDALEQHIADERQTAPAVVRIEATLREMPYLPRSARKAVTRALKLQTYPALEHAQLVLRRLQEEEEELAVLLALALH